MGVLGALEVVVRVERVENFGGFFARAHLPVAGGASLAETDGSNGSSPVSVRLRRGGGRGGAVRRRFERRRRPELMVE